MIEKERTEQVSELFDKLEIWRENKSTLIRQFLPQRRVKKA